MSYDPGGSNLADQALLKRRSRPSTSPTSSENEGWMAEGPVDPAPAPVPSVEEQRRVDSPPLHDDQYPDGDGQGENKRRTDLLRRHPFAAAVGALLFLPVAAGGYLYWNNSRHFESTDDSFITARAFSISPKVSGYLTAVPVTDNQHVVAGEIIARIDQRDYQAALDQATAQLRRDIVQGCLLHRYSTREISDAFRPLADLAAVGDTGR
jgi:hypothetical protein